MMEPRFIYRNRSDTQFYDASSGEMRGGPDKVIVYLPGVICAMDRQAKIAIPVSRWELMEIGLACCFAALKGNGAANSSIEPVPLPLSEQAPEGLPEPPPETTSKESSEDPWDRLMRDMRDLSR